MKLYQTSKGTYCEKASDFYEQQVAECGNRKSDYDHNGAAVEFPFAASPKADFVAWLNAAGLPQAPAPHHDEPDLLGEELPVDRYVREQAAQPKPEPSRPRQTPTVDGFMHWLLDEASNADIENVFSAIGARFHEAQRPAR